MTASNVSLRQIDIAKRYCIFQQAGKPATDLNCRFNEIKTVQGHLAQVIDCKATVLNYEQMIKIVDLNEREGQFFNDNEDSK